MYTKSFYNYYIPYKDRVVYFNGIYSQCFSVNNQEHEKIQSLIEDPVEFQMNYPSIFNKFVEWGFLFDENLPEIDILKFRNKVSVFEDKNYYLVINPTLECNFNCWYCYEEHPQGHMDDKTIEKVKKHIQYMIEKKRITELHLSWYGGEPFLYFEEVVYPISLFAKNICQKNNIPYTCHATTNASKITPENIEKMNEVNFSSFQITIDGGSERHNKIRNDSGKPSFDNIIQNIILICDKIKDVGISFRINYDEQTLKDESLRKVFETIPKKYRKHIFPNFQRVWQTGKMSKNDKENNLRLDLINYCYELGYPQASPANAFKIGDRPCKCYADRLYHAEINYDGLVYSCTMNGYTREYAFGELEESGKITLDNEKLIKKLGKATFENDMCLSCKHLPLCFGPCTRKMMDTPVDQLKNICALNYTEVQPETVILDYFKKKEGIYNNF